MCSCGIYIPYDKSSRENFVYRKDRIPRRNRKSSEFSTFFGLDWLEPGAFLLDGERSDMTRLSAWAICGGLGRRRLSIWWFGYGA